MTRHEENVQQELDQLLKGETWVHRFNLRKYPLTYVESALAVIGAVLVAVLFFS